MGELRSPTIARILTVVVGLSFLLETTLPLDAYEPETHRAISNTAADRSSLDDILKDQYRVENGIAFQINGQEIREWIGTGGNLEDTPAFRALNHFHNPLQPWPQAGGITGQSSIYWQQNSNQGSGGTWSWPVARRHLLDFLTRTSSAERNTALSNTARALGQMMHMIQDATSPPHTRNDPHFIHDGYEARVEELRASPQGSSERGRFLAFLSAPSISSSLSIFTPTGDPQASVPIARLIDSDTYVGTAASYTTGGQIGAAEYTNGGYVSDDTIFMDFPLPRPASLGAGFFDPPAGTSGARQYFPKETDGDAIPHFVAEGTLFERLRFRGQLFGGYFLDDKVYQDYASLLIPRAVGYSAALIDYFFRGKLDVELVPNATDSSLVDLRAINRSPDALGPGQLTLYFETAAGTRREIPGALLGLTEPVAQDATLPTLTFALPFGTTKLVLAYQGTLGQEAGAVAGKVIEGNSVVYTVAASPPGVFTLSQQELAFRDCGVIAGSKLAISLGSSGLDRPAAPVDVFLFLSNQFVGAPVLTRSGESLQVIVPLRGVFNLDLFVGTIQSNSRIFRSDLLAVGYRCPEQNPEVFTCPLGTGEVAPPFAQDGVFVETPAALNFSPSDPATFLAATQGHGFLRPSANARVVKAVQPPPPLSTLKTTAEYLATMEITELCPINPPTPEQIRASSGVQDSVDIGADFEYVITGVESGLEAARVSVPVYLKSPLSGF